MIAVENWKPEPERCDERARLTRREQRYDRYQQVMTLYEQGLGFTEITHRVGLSRRTIERWIKEGEFPEAKRRRKRRSVFDPYAEYVLSRWEQGCTNGLQLCQEIQAQGYQGSAQTVYRYLRALRKKRRVIWKPEVPFFTINDNLPSAWIKILVEGVYECGNALYDVATRLLQRRILISQAQRLSEGWKRLDALSPASWGPDLTTGTNPPLLSADVHLKPKSSFRDQI